MKKMYLLISVKINTASQSLLYNQIPTVRQKQTNWKMNTDM